ncbi:Molybdopterin synthase/thiamin biosynthesis sulphur carrier, beta-grasp [Moorella glycerini]|uniref:ThiS family protein n=2 Tax=Neomoorella stamsii TaxID=1266720 RepID=A0A9X7J524_9FIRM|nr:ThiS family protein [Moorella stamsii]CEP67248.1 Molybdopterin synthase/thiamin biosynthesis sulphur carrier, beta-grasp [Moorella glycerini]
MFIVHSGINSADGDVDLMPRTTMTIRIKYISHLATLTGREKESIDLPLGTSLSGLFKNLAQKYGHDLANYFLNPETGDFWLGVAIVVNNRLVASFKETPPLQDGDEILLLPAAEGG